MSLVCSLHQTSVYGNKSFFSKEADSKILQSIYVAYEAGIISSSLLSNKFPGKVKS